MSWNYDPYTGEPLQGKWAFDPYTGEKIEKTAKAKPSQNPPEPPVVRSEMYSPYNSSSNSTGIVGNIILVVITLLLIFIVGLMGAGTLARFASSVIPAHKVHSTQPSHSVVVPKDGPQIEIGDGDHIWIVPESSTGSAGDVIAPSEPSGSKGDSYDPREHSNVEFR